MQENARAAEPGRLTRSLSHRQINMVAIGGIIGTGLFVGSGLLVQTAGPAVILAYLGMGLVVLLVMRMLGELAVDKPDSGSYAAYAAREIGPWAGGMLSYTVIYGGVVVVALEAVYIGFILGAAVPVLAAPVWSVIVAAALIGFNLLRVQVFAEAEFWIALVKVVAIIGFIGLGVAAFFGLLPGLASPGLVHWAPFAPNGWLPVVAACVSVLFAYVGTEQVVILAAEAKEPREVARRALNSVVLRILIFFVGSVLVIITFSPQGAPGLAEGSYAYVLTSLGFPQLAGLLNIVILTSLLSLANTTVYTTSRMIFAAAGRGDLPRGLGHASSHGVPVRAVLVVAVGVAALVATNFFLPATELLTLLMALVGTGALITYAAIAITQLRFRARLTPEQVAGLRMKMWFHPWGAILTLTILTAILVVTLLLPETRTTTLLTVAFSAACAGAALLVQRRRGRGHVAPVATAAGAAS